MSDLMLLGVLRMPAELVNTRLAVVQLVGRAHEAADRIAADAAEIETLRAVLQDILAAGPIKEYEYPLLMARAKAALDGGGV